MTLIIQKQITKSVTKLYLKLQDCNLSQLNISDYNRVYLKNYIDNYDFYMSIYTQLLSKSINKLNKPISESTFIDYGGGCGMLSYLAKELGFKSVIYNDIYQTSVADTHIIAEALNLKIDHFICGDVEFFVSEINKQQIRPDLICSFDVLEHIYKLEEWFNLITKIKCRFDLLFMTHANSQNPFITNRLKKLQINAEYDGIKKSAGWKEIDLNTSYYEARKNIIIEKFHHLNDGQIELLAKKTRGLRKDDIEKVVRHFINTSEISYQIKHPTNTCDPFTGNWAEHLIDLKQLKNIIIKNQLTVEITNSFYSYSNNKLLNIPKYLINFIIKVLGKNHLIFSPTYTIEIQKTAID